MAERPVFIMSEDGGVGELPVVFSWVPGMSMIQKQRCVASLHSAAARYGFGRLLEVSTKSPSNLGVSLSALNLVVDLPGTGTTSVECAFQGSKVFRDAGPFPDLYRGPSRAAKRDGRLRSSGPLIGFDLAGDRWPLEPKTAFYDWLYSSALLQNPELSNRLEGYDGFTDIEFNPKKSLNTQARSCALFVSWQRADMDIADLVASKTRFLAAVGVASGSPRSSQLPLFS